eukprot:3536681-Prorocentrum_lima.AAC.1
MGAHNGAVGLCGRESRHFYAVPLVAHPLQSARLDLRVHVLIENARGPCGQNTGTPSSKRSR